MRPTIVIALAALLCACASQSPPPEAEAVTLRLPGFTATAPPAPRWIATPGIAQALAAVRAVGESRTVTAFASEADLRDIGGAHPDVALERAIAEIRSGYDGGRHRLLRFDEAPDADGCRSYALSAEDTGVPDRAGRLYVVDARGRICVFPEQNLVARVEYSDRHLPQESPIPSFEGEAKAFLQSLSVPGA